MTAEIIKLSDFSKPGSTVNGTNGTGEVINLHERITEKLKTGDFVLPYVENGDKEEKIAELFKIFQEKNKFVSFPEDTSALSEDTIILNEDNVCTGNVNEDLWIFFKRTFGNGEWKVSNIKDDGTLVLIYSNYVFELNKKQQSLITKNIFANEYR